MAVPFIDLKRSVSPIVEDVLEDWRGCLEQTSFVNGESVRALERAVSTHLGAPPMVACANGTDAIIVALQAIGIGPGARVALPNLTFWATYEMVVQRGATPVLIDIDESLQMDFAELSAAHDAAPLDAVLLPHLFGWCSPHTPAIRAFCVEQGIGLVEDAAQAFGVALEGRSVLDTELATLSFYPAKVLGGASDGGAIFARDPERAAQLRRLCNHGRTGHYSYAEVGWNSRMSSPNAAFLLRMLARVDAMLESRRTALERYRTEIAGWSDGRVQLHLPPEGIVGNGYLAVVTVDGVSGVDLEHALRARQIGCARTYPETIGEQAPAQGCFEAVSDLERSRAFCERVINLPLFAGISSAECDEALSGLRAALGELLG